MQLISKLIRLYVYVYGTNSEIFCPTYLLRYIKFPLQDLDHISIVYNLQPCIWNFFRWNHQFWPLKVWCLQKLAPQHCLWPHFFIAESFSTQKMWMFAKKLELNPLRFDRDIRVLSEKNTMKNFPFFDLQTKNAVNQRVSKIFPKFFSTWSVITPLGTTSIKKKR